MTVTNGVLLKGETSQGEEYMRFFTHEQYQAACKVNDMAGWLFSEIIDNLAQWYIYFDDNICIYNDGDELIMIDVNTLKVIRREFTI